VRLASLAATFPSDLIPWPTLAPGPIVVITGRTPARHAAVARLLARMADDVPALEAQMTTPVEWPFAPPGAVLPPTESGPLVVVAPDLHETFVSLQGNSTRLVTTQPLFVMQGWLDAVRARPGLALVATADEDVLRVHAEEAVAKRGAWRHVAWISADETDVAGGGLEPPRHAPSPLAVAFRDEDPAGRLVAGGRALDAERTPAHLLAMASVCMEVNDLDNAGALLAEAVTRAPDWPATHFEHGKYWLRRDDMAAAAVAFGRTVALMPTFASAAANWGATLGELDRPVEALSAFATALESDPDNPQALNNSGVVARELGRLAESEAAFRRVIGLTPDLAFGHYNLGHTLFLQGRYQASLASYQAGQRLDPARNPVQASRLALARLATGDAHGALRDLQGCTANLPRDYRRQLLSDAQSIAWALLSAAPDLREWRVVGDWLAGELARA
jgi:tetratricopeptide (TPR) repeat protein